MSTHAERARQYIGAIGKRKTAVARVKLYQDGTGEAKVNGFALKTYFDTPFAAENAVAPLALTNHKSSVDIDARIVGGGKIAQSDALRHAISRALILLNPDLRGDLKRAGFLRRDSRIKERKKPGLKRARRAPQFSKR
jgi:small subunit ribosomal protein S9